MLKAMAAASKAARSIWPVMSFWEVFSPFTKTPKIKDSVVDKKLTRGESRGLKPCCMLLTQSTVIRTFWSKYSTFFLKNNKCGKKNHSSKKITKKSRLKQKLPKNFLCIFCFLDCSSKPQYNTCKSQKYIAKCEYRSGNNVKNKLL